MSVDAVSRQADMQAKPAYPRAGANRWENLVGSAVTAARHDWPIWLMAGVTFANGLLGLVSVLAVRYTERPELFSLPLPFGLYHSSRLLTLTFGLFLLYLSFHLVQRRKAAWWLATFGTGVAALAHIGRGHVWFTALAPAATVSLLVLFRKRYTVRSEPRSIAQGLGLVLGCLLIALAYGTVGFWLLDKRDFGLEFSVAGALVRTLREFTLVGNGDLVAHTRHARMFLESLDILGFAAVLFAAYSLFRPVAYRLATLPRQRAIMKAILDQYGRTSLDYFKLWRDKAYFFSGDHRASIAYRTVGAVALALGDPVGPPEELEDTTRAFLHYCADNGWAVAFHQAVPDLLSMYRRLGLQVLKIGEEAIVDLERFPETVKSHKHLRHTRNQFEKGGYKLVRSLPPHDPAVLEQVEEVSHEWLQIPGRHERTFSLGSFDRDYINGTSLALVQDTGGRIIAFANEVPSYRSGEATIDLMRHRLEVPNGTMDYLFMALMLTLREQGYRTFNLGMAPYAGVGDGPDAALEERVAHELAELANRFVSYKGMRDYKAKYEPVWEERFLVYQGGPLGLVKTAIALARATDLQRSA